MNAFRKSVALLAAVVAAPALASSDGTLGPTSNGTFTVTASISPDASDDVHVYGLDDFSFSGTEGGTINSQEKTFCIIRSPNGGTVNLTVSSFDAADTYFRVKTPGGADEIQMLLSIYDQGDALYYPLTESSPMSLQVADTCTDVGSDPAVQLLAISLLNTSTANPGNYSNSFLVTVAPE